MQRKEHLELYVANKTGLAKSAEKYEANQLFILKKKGKLIMHLECELHGGGCGKLRQS